MDMVRLGDYVKIDSGFAFNSNNFSNTTGMPIVRIRDVTSGCISTFYNGEYDDKYIISNCDILISMDGNFIVRKWTNNKALLNQRVCRVKSSDIRKLSNDYLYYILPKYLKIIEDRTPFATVKHLSVKDISEIKLYLPDKRTQNKIIDTLNIAQSLIDKRKEQIKECDRLIKSLFYDMFGDPIKNSKNWKVTCLDRITTLVTKGESPNWQGYSYQNDGVRFITSENVLMGKLNNEKVKYIPEEFHNKLKRSHLKKDDILINLVGASIGRGAMVSNEILPANINQAVALVRFKNDIVNINFMLQQIITPSIQQSVLDNRVEGARANISLTDIRNLKIILPPLEYQNKFVEYAQYIEKQKQLLVLSLSLLEDNFNALMQKAFKGELFS